MSNYCKNCGVPICSICNKPIPQYIPCCGQQGIQGIKGDKGDKGDSAELIKAYAEYNTFENVSNNQPIPFEDIYDVGGLTSISAEDTVFTLKSGYVYQFCFNVQASNNTDFRFQVTPLVNNQLQTWNSTASTNIAIDSSAVGSVSECFLVEAKTDTDIKLQMSTSIAGSLLLQGAVYIHPVSKL